LEGGKNVHADIVKAVGKGDSVKGFELYKEE
jgi:hypothetical protein